MSKVQFAGRLQSLPATDNKKPLDLSGRNGTIKLLNLSCYTLGKLVN